MKFSKTEKIIHRYLTEENNQHQSAEEIADKLYVSRASIYRVCRKMGYSSFSEYRHLFFLSKRDLLNVNSLEVFDHVNDAQLPAILDRIVSSEKIYVFGSHATSMVSSYFARQLANLGYCSILVSDGFELQSRLRSFVSSDYLVCFSNGGRYTPDVIAWLRDAPIKIMAITKEGSPLAMVSDHTISFDFPSDKNKAFDRESQFNLMVIAEKILINLTKFDHHLPQ